MPTRHRVDPERVRALWEAGRTDREAAAELGCSPQRVKAVRLRHGCRGCRSWTPERRAAAAAQVAARLAAAGVRSLRQLAPGDPHRRARAAALAESYGLPADLYPCQVLVLLALAGGPLTTAELVRLAGRRPRARDTDAYQSFNAPKIGCGNYLKDLRERGLVAFTGRRRVGRHGFEPGENFLTPLAMDLLTSRSES